MRLIFMGTPAFAADILRDIVPVHDVICVYTMPDKVRGRGNRLVPSEVKKMAESLDLEVRTPSTLRDPEEVEYIKSLKPDVICVAAYGKILSSDILDIAPYGCLNVHASLLPRWRGAAPIERAILAGDNSVGVCIMQMEESLDTGDYCIRRELPCVDMSYEELSRELAFLGSEALLTSLSQLEDGSIKWVAQSDEEAMYAEKLSRGELDLDPSLSAVDNIRHVLASNELHPARFILGDRNITATSVRLADDKAAPISDYSAGDVLFTKKRLFLACSDGLFEINSLKPAGKKEMPASAFLSGAHLDPSVKWARPA